MRTLTQIALGAMAVPSLVHAQRDTVRVTADAARGRAEASTESAVATTVTKGAPLTVGERNDAWLEVRASSKAGYVQSNMVVAAGRAPAAPVPNTAAVSNRGDDARPDAQPTPAPAPTASAGRFETGPFYAGPRLNLGGLNGGIAVGAQIERGFSKPGSFGPGIISGGLAVDYYSYDQDFLIDRFSVSVIPVQLFSNYHFIVSSQPKLDPYAGLSLVYSIVRTSYAGIGYNAGSYTDVEGHVGARYFLKDDLAIQGQLGFGYGNLSIGATWRF